MFFRLLNAVVVAFALSAASVVQARSVSFEIINNTGYTLTAIYTGPSSFEDWGHNILDRHARHADDLYMKTKAASLCFPF